MDLQTLIALGVLSVESLTADIVALPNTPTRIGALGIFDEQGIDTTVAMIGLDGSKLTLVPAVPRGAPSQPKSLGARTAKPFIVPRLPQRSTIMADSVRGPRRFGSAPAAAWFFPCPPMQGSMRAHRRGLSPPTAALSSRHTLARCPDFRPVGVVSVPRDRICP